MEYVDSLYENIVLSLLIDNLNCVEVTKYFPEPYNVVIGYKNILHILKYDGTNLSYCKCNDVCNLDNLYEKIYIPGNMMVAINTFIKILK